MNCGLFYAIPIINVVILTDHLFYNVYKKKNQFSDVYSLFLKRDNKQLASG